MSICVWNKTVHKAGEGYGVFARFLLSGGFNTFITYILYLLLLIVFSYQISYTISYCGGVLLAYYLNRLVVFKSHRGVWSLLFLPVAYAIQYLLTSVVLWGLVKGFGVDERLALPIAIVLLIPLNFFLSKKIFLKNN